jgi:hypothetical protein
MAILDPRTGQTVRLPLASKPAKPKDKAPVTGSGEKRKLR